MRIFHSFVSRGAAATSGVRSRISRTHAYNWPESKNVVLRIERRIDRWHDRAQYILYLYKYVHAHVDIPIRFH